MFDERNKVANLSMIMSQISIKFHIHVRTCIDLDAFHTWLFATVERFVISEFLLYICAQEEVSYFNPGVRCNAAIKRPLISMWIMVT